VTRIIAGFAGSLALSVPVKGTRPTSDRVREAIFSALDARGALPGARVVDLYAGSGALGLEAASRGASHVALVERNPAAAAACRKNAALVRSRAPKDRMLTIDVVASPVQSFLSTQSLEWDIAFLDPPYDQPDDELLLALGTLAHQLAADATVMLERSSRSSELAWPAGLALERRKAYGDTALWWLRPQPADQPAALSQSENGSQPPPE
jgi:16S rRNA (guanine966-N2)-methyltransferase